MGPGKVHPGLLAGVGSTRALVRFRIISATFVLFPPLAAPGANRQGRALQSSEVTTDGSRRGVGAPKRTPFDGLTQGYPPTRG